MRLIGVTAVILLAVIGMVLATGTKQGAYEGDLAAVAKDSKLVGKQVKVAAPSSPGRGTRSPTRCASPSAPSQTPLVVVRP